MAHKPILFYSLDVAADPGEELLSRTIKQLAHWLELALERVPGTLPLSEGKFLYPDLWIHAATSLVLLVCWLFMHGVIFALVTCAVFSWMWPH